jgi:hypothetical protein
VNDGEDVNAKAQGQIWIEPMEAVLSRGCFRRLPFIRRIVLFFAS